jgi:Fe-S-cluster containining protein
MKMDSIFDATQPWYAAGLAFECTGCGDCCAGPDEGYVWVTDADIRAIAEQLHITEDQMRRDYVRKVGRRQSLREVKRTKDCAFLTECNGDGRGCKVYSARPIQCRTWPFWPGNLTSPDAWAHAGMRCRGINRGRRYTLEEIQQRASVTIE